MLWKYAVIASLLIGITCAFCPFSEALIDGHIFYDEYKAKENRLIAEGIVVTDADPGHIFFTTAPLNDDTKTWYKTASTLLFSELAYCDNLNPLMHPAALFLLKEEEKCVPHHDRCKVNAAPICDPYAKFRSLDGTCNNLENPTWASGFTPYNRIGEAVFSDLIYNLRKSVVKNKDLPRVRDIGNIALQTSGFENDPYGPNVVNFNWLSVGEYIGLDVGQRQSLQSNSGGNGFRCCTEDYKIPPESQHYFGCDPFVYRKDDPLAAPFNRTCSPYIRSQTMTQDDCSIIAAAPVNGVTHFLDNSNIYGFNDEVAQAQRTFEGGTIQIVNGILPQLPDCANQVPNFFECYHIAGSPRSVISPTEALIHSVFLRLHNYLADSLNELNPHWNGDDDKLYFEARRIQIALYQHLLYDEYLPLFFGRTYAIEHGLVCEDGALFCGEYDATINPSTLTEFSHGAFPQLHANLPPSVSFFDKDFDITQTFDIAKYLVGPPILEDLYNDGLRALLVMKLNFGKFNDLLRNNLFANDNVDNLGIDLLSDDIFRGRDHGHSPYHVYYSLCTNKTIKSWKDLNGVISEKHIQLLSKLYDSVLDLDLYVGVSLEIRNIGYDKTTEYVGIVGKCIITEQFKRYKYGDRFFYSFEDSPNNFTPAQMTAIKNYTFGKHYCMLVDIEQMLPKALELPNDLYNPFTDCCEFETLDLTPFQEIPDTDC